MQSSLQNSSPNSKTHSFSPFLAKPLSAETTTPGFFPNSVCFSSKHNMIIACTLDNTMQFYDATTLFPLKERKPHNLHAWVRQMSYHPETDSYLLGCNNGSIYLYNATSEYLKKLIDCFNAVVTITFVNPSYYAFSVVYSRKLFLGTLKDENMISFGPYNCNILSLRYLTQQKFLLAGLENGSLVMYRTDKLPNLPIFCSVSAFGRDAFITQSINFNGKEYIMTVGGEANVKIWHLIKGRMRLLKVIQTERPSDSVVYLEKYNMIAIPFESEEIMFFRFPSGKLGSTISLKQNNDSAVFLMKEKNMIGVTSTGSHAIQFIQLGGPKEYL